MADNPFTPSAGSKIIDSPLPVKHTGLHIVKTAVHKYAEYLVKKGNTNIDNVIDEGRRRVRKTYIETADFYYSRIPEEHR